MQQHVDVPTHKSGHTLDLIITRCVDSLLSTNLVADCLFSDHFTVISDLIIKKPSLTIKQISYELVMQAPIMAARLNLAPFIFFFIPNFLNNKYVLKHQGSSKDHFHVEEYKVFQNSCEFGTPLWFSRTSCVWRPSSTPRLHRSLSLWSKRGHLCLTKPDWDPVMALTIHMNTSRNPGPNSVAETI